MPIRKSNDSLFYLIGIIPVVWLALLLAQSLGGGLPELLRKLTSALEQPTNNPQRRYVYYLNVGKRLSANLRDEQENLF